MRRLGPFEAAPTLAVALSGGPDSLALAWLADGWARGCGGRIVALTVDHGLRPEAADEAATVARLMAARGIAHEVLAWRIDADRPTGQAAARRARYDLLEAACRRRGILHLLTGHTADDQAETVLLRLAKGSGPDGLAGMPAIAERASVRVLRPLLGWRKAALVAVCQAAGLAWIDDPSNRSERVARGRLRRSLPVLAREGLSAERLVDLARRAAPARRRTEAVVAAALGDALAVFPEGYAVLRLAAWRTQPEDVRLAMLGRILRAVGAADYPPRDAALARLAGRLLDGGSPNGADDSAAGGATLGGCRLVPTGDGLLIAREPAAARERRAAAPGSTVLWDGRLTVHLPADLPPPTAARPYTLARLGHAAGRAIPSAAAPALPAVARAALPGLWSADGRLIAAAAVPFGRPDRLPPTALARLPVLFTPPAPIAGAGFGAA